ncbi:MAG: Ppx/GppA family phosphatase [Deltaproteobacteria bacterium]|nr:Ppx/GppA family phosphatase [Deltaproteobacteria bacterium]
MLGNQRYASIDIGTNTLRLLIAEADEGGRLKPLIYKRAITRLGGSYTEDRGIDPGSAERTLKVLEDFAKVISGNGVCRVLAFATSIVRRAKNRGFFLEAVRERTGIGITVISGVEEARLSLLGVLSVIDDSGGDKLVIDIGGGSTEFIFTKDTGIAGEWSMEMGVVHLSEKYLKGDPPKRSELDSLEHDIKRVIKGLKVQMNTGGVDPLDYCGSRGAVFVGTAGTITTLAALDQNLEVYDRSRINNYTLTVKRVREIYGYLCSLTLKEREEVLTLEKGREDLIIPGTAITLLVMDEFGFDELKVSDAGLLEGIIIREFNNEKKTA